MISVYILSTKTPVEAGSKIDIDEYANVDCVIHLTFKDVLIKYSELIDEYRMAGISPIIYMVYLKNSIVCEKFAFKIESISFIF